MTSTDPGYEGADCGEPIPAAGRLKASDRPIIPSMYAEKSRLRDNPDLTFENQLQGLLLGQLMEMAGIFELDMTSLQVAKNRMRRIEVSETETGGIRATRTRES